MMRNRRSILIIEDELELADLMKARFDEEGFSR